MVVGYSVVMAAPIVASLQPVLKHHNLLYSINYHNQEEKTCGAQYENTFDDFEVMLSKLVDTHTNSLLQIT